LDICLKVRNGSRNNRLKAKAKVARQHQKIANERADFYHRIGLRLVRGTQVIHTEDLAVENMVKNHCLAKSSSDATWHIKGPGEAVTSTRLAGSSHQTSVAAIVALAWGSSLCA
jgi:hypothetical protein